VASDSDIPRKSHRRGFLTPAALVPGSGPAPNILYTGFTNANAMPHVANCVANAGRIESGDSYKFYAEGVTGDRRAGRDGPEHDREGLCS
jgi:hypothetical protein